MKNFLLTLIAVLSCNILFAQVLKQDNFDAYTVGDKIAVANATNWDTWSSAPGGGEDPVVSSDFAASPANSLHITNDKDCVFALDNKTTGRYSVNFKLLIKSGNIGYFNVLQNFAGADSKWGMQVYFNPNGKGTLDAGTASAANFTYEHEKWIPVTIFVDLDKDYASLVINEKSLVSWKWSGGSFGDGTLKQLGAINFYGTKEGGNSSMFIDDVIYKQLEAAPTTPTGLTATLDNGKNVLLSWDASSEANAIYIVNNGSSILGTTTETQMTEENIYPGEASYTVQVSSLDLGDSDVSDAVSVTRLGGQDRDLVLFEVGTGTDCPNCPSAARGVDEMVEKGENVAILEYHNYNSSDPYNNADAAARCGYYGISGYPTQIHDGTTGQKGGSYNGTLYPTYHNFYAARTEVLSLYGINVEIESTSSTEYTAKISMDENSDYYETLAKTLRVAVTETDILYTWQGLSHVDFAVRKMFPNAAGTNIDFSGNSNQTIDIPFTLDPTWTKDNCELVVFLQMDETKEVLQTIKIDMASVFTSVEELDQLEVNIYPNPATNVLHTSIQTNFDYSIRSITGQELQRGTSTNSRIDIGEMGVGIYILNITTKDGIAQKKFVKN